MFCLPKTAWPPTSLTPYINGTAAAGQTDYGKAITEWKCAPGTMDQKYLPEVGS